MAQARRDMVPAVGANLVVVGLVVRCIKLAAPACGPNELAGQTHGVGERVGIVNLDVEAERRL